MGVGVDKSDTDILFKKLKAKKALPRAARVMLVHIHSEASPYPRVSRRKAEFKDDRARRAFFWRLANGKIQVPYQRGGSFSENLSKRWRFKGDGMKQSLENNASYAAKTIGRPQIRYHKKTGWPQIRKVLDNEKRTLGKILGVEVQRELER